MAVILILDDQATNRSIYARLAAAIEEGVSVEAFADPLDALEWLEHNRVDLVITDYKMPEMDGAEFTRRLRAMPGGLHVPVLVVTAHDDRQFRGRALDAGATDFLQSPIDHFELVTRARNLLALGRQPSPAAAAREAPRPPPAPPGPVAGDPDWLARILDTVPAMISAADRDGRCLFANASLAESLGATPAELIGAAADRLFGAERAARHRSDDLLVFATGEALPARREEIADHAGRRRRLLTVKTPLRDATGAVTAVVTTSFDCGPAADTPDHGGSAA